MVMGLAWRPLRTGCGATLPLATDRNTLLPLTIPLVFIFAHLHNYDFLLIAPALTFTRIFTKKEVGYSGKEKKKLIHAKIRN